MHVVPGARLPLSMPYAAILAALLATLSAPAAWAQASTKAKAPHVHGAGTLAMAIEGRTVELELEAPAHDIVGFENAPRNARQSKAHETARAALGKLASVLELPAAAGCTVKSTQVVFTGGKGGHGHSHGHAHDKPKKSTDPKAAAAAEDDHSEFRATYRLDCAEVASLTPIGFPYFKQFKGADRLTVSIVAPKGQSQFEVTRDKPRLDLSGLM